jgi:tRNA dimethylallyltransferase
LADADVAAPEGRAARSMVRTIVGPTAAGKSAIAMWLASRHPLVIISADSRQIYRGFDIGTAKPSRDERARVAHRGVDIADPTQRCSAFAWAAAASAWIADAQASGLAPLVVGGTGLYARALYETSFEEPELSPERRGRLEGFLATLSTAELRRWCLALDRGRAHLGRTQLLRAVEVALIAGQRLSDLHVTRRRPAPHRARYLVVDPGRALANRITRRARSMLQRGWLDEVRALDAVVPPHAPAWNSTGYRAIRSLVRGEAAEADVLDQVIVETRQYAKRQRTWFRHQLPEHDVTRIDPAETGWEDVVERWWNGDSVR